MTTVTKVRWKSWEGTPGEESLEATWENRHRQCGRDVLGQVLHCLLHCRLHFTRKHSCCWDSRSYCIGNFGVWGVWGLSRCRG